MERRMKSTTLTSRTRSPPSRKHCHTFPVERMKTSVKKNKNEKHNTHFSYSVSTFSTGGGGGIGGAAGGSGGCPSPGSGGAGTSPARKAGRAGRGVRHSAVPQRLPGTNTNTPAGPAWQLPAGGAPVGRT